MYTFQIFISSVGLKYLVCHIYFFFLPLELPSNSFIFKVLVSIPSLHFQRGGDNSVLREMDAMP